MLWHMYCNDFCIKLNALAEFSLTLTEMLTTGTHIIVPVSLCLYEHYMCKLRVLVMLASVT